jgi:hypothetical protein
VLPPEASRAAGIARDADGPLRPLLAIAAALAFLGGCGDEEGETTDSAAGEGSLLELTLDTDGPGPEKPRTATVDCPEPSQATADELCGRVLLLSPDAFDPVSPGAACTEIYGGPDALTVVGTLEGEEVEGEFTRENGCEIDRFEAWTPILKDLFEGYEPGGAIQAP